MFEEAACPSRVFGASFFRTSSEQQTQAAKHNAKWRLRVAMPNVHYYTRAFDVWLLGNLDTSWQTQNSNREFQSTDHLNSMSQELWATYCNPTSRIVGGKYVSKHLIPSVGLYHAGTTLECLWAFEPFLVKRTWMNPLHWARKHWGEVARPLQRLGDLLLKRSCCVTLQSQVSCGGLSAMRPRTE